EQPIFFTRLLSSEPFLPSFSSIIRLSCNPGSQKYSTDLPSFFPQKVNLIFLAPASPQQPQSPPLHHPSGAKATSIKRKLRPSSLTFSPKTTSREAKQKHKRPKWCNTRLNGEFYCPSIPILHSIWLASFLSYGCWNYQVLPRS